MVWATGSTTGPPADREYAVDPVGRGHDDAVPGDVRQVPAV